jgi:YbbR domain-containing protein
MLNKLFNRNSKRMKENLSTLIMSILLALIVWIFAVDQENPLQRQDFNQAIPIEVRGLGEGLQTLQDLTRRTVVLNLRAPRSSWEALTVDDFEVYINLSGLSAGTHEVQINVEPVNPDVSVIDVEPRSLRVQIEAITSKTVPVQVEIMDSPAFSYEWQTPIVEPETVTVSGPRAQVEQVTSVVAEVFLRNARSQVERTQILSPRNAQNLTVERVNLNTQSANIVVPIVQRPGRKEVAVLVPIEGQPAPGYRLINVATEPNTIILRGSPEALREVGGYIETPPLNIENATGDVRERLPLLLPENISTLGETGVSAVITIVPIESSRSVSREATVQGLNSNLRATLSPERVDVILSGPQPRLDGLTVDDVRVTLDLAELLPGSHSIAPRVFVPEGLRVEGIIPQSIEVTIEQIALPTPTPDSSGRSNDADEESDSSAESETKTQPAGLTVELVEVTPDSEGGSDGEGIIESTRPTSEAAAAPSDLLGATKGEETLTAHDNGVEYLVEDVVTEDVVSEGNQFAETENPAIESAANATPDPSHLELEITTIETEPTAPRHAP